VVGGGAMRHQGAFALVVVSALLVFAAVNARLKSSED